MTHPDPAELALYAGAELSWLRRLRVGGHVRRCAACRWEVERFREARTRLRDMAWDEPAGLNWERLAAEMRANIHVGLAAAECVGPEPVSGRSRWRMAVTAIPVAALLLATLLLQRPRLEPRPPSGAVVLEAASDGIALRQGEAVLKLQHPSGRDVTYTVNTQGVLRARFVDAETGYVTVNLVYAH